jgi:hypothetical protein
MKIVFWGQRVLWLEQSLDLQGADIWDVMHSLLLALVLDGVLWCLVGLIMF